MGPFPCFWLTTPNLRNLVSRLYTKIGTQGKGSKNKTTCDFYWPTFPVLSHRLKWKLPKDYDSKLAFLADHCCFGLGVSENESMTRNLSLALEDTAESTAKAGAAQQNSLDSLGKAVPNIRILSLIIF